MKDRLTTISHYWFGKIPGGFNFNICGPAERRISTRQREISGPAAALRGEREIFSRKLIPRFSRRLSLQSGNGSHYNLGIGKGYSVRDVIHVVQEISGLPIPVKEAPRRAGDPPLLVACADKAREKLGWQPHYTELRPIIETAWNWHKTHPRGFGDRP